MPDFTCSLMRIIIATTPACLVLSVPYELYCHYLGMPAMYLLFFSSLAPLLLLVWHPLASPPYTYCYITITSVSGVLVHQLALCVGASACLVSLLQLAWRLGASARLVSLLQLAWCLCASACLMFLLQFAWCIGDSVCLVSWCLGLPGVLVLQFAWCLGASACLMFLLQFAWCIGDSVCLMFLLQFAWCLGASACLVSWCFSLPSVFVLPGVFFLQFA